MSGVRVPPGWPIQRPGVSDNLGADAAVMGRSGAGEDHIIALASCASPHRGSIGRAARQPLPVPASFLKLRSEELHDVLVHGSVEAPSVETVGIVAQKRRATQAAGNEEGKVVRAGYDMEFSAFA